MPVGNPATIQIPANCIGQVTASARALYEQKLQIKFGDIQTYFNGSGENVAMKDATGSTSWTFTSLGREDIMELTFLFRPEGDDDYHLAKVDDITTSREGPFTIYTIGSEDSSDGDNNDTVVKIFCFSPI